MGSLILGDVCQTTTKYVQDTPQSISSDGPACSSLKPLLPHSKCIKSDAGDISYMLNSDQSLYTLDVTCFGTLPTMIFLKQTLPTVLVCAQLLPPLLMSFSYAHPLASGKLGIEKSGRGDTSDGPLAAITQSSSLLKSASYIGNTIPRRSTTTADNFQVHCWLASDHNLLPVSPGSCAKTLHFMARYDLSQHNHRWIRGRQINFNWPGEDCDIGFHAFPKPPNREMWMTTFEIALVAQAVMQGCSDQDQHGKGGHTRFRHGEDEGVLVIMAPFRGFHTPVGIPSNLTNAAFA